MTSGKVIAAIVVIIIIAGGAYYLSDIKEPVSESQDIATTTATTTDQTGDGSDISENLTLGVDSTSTLGMYLIAYNGMTLYSYSKDTAGVSNCSGQCAVNWPPYIIPAGMNLNLEAQVTGAASTIVRADGTTQVTYNGMPLYFYIKDKVSGDTTGQNVGGVWFVVKP